MGTSSSAVNEGSMEVDGHSSYGLLFASGCTACQFDNNGLLELDNGSNASTPAIFYQVSGNHLNNNGTLHIGATSHAGIGIGFGAASAGAMTNNGTVTIYNTGASRSGMSVGFLGGAFINNSGAVLNLEAGIGSTWLGGFNMALTNDGTININKTGTVNANVYGTGAFGGTAAFENSNTFSPASSAIGCLTFNSGYSNISTSPAPSTNIGLAGTTGCTLHDKINVTGTANLTGTLNLSLVSGHTPTSGNSYTILEATNIVGTYSTVNYPTVSGINWTISYTGTSVTVNAQSAFPVELVEFKAKMKQNNQVLLTWETATEQNNSGFFIERSKDGNDWKEIGFVAGNGTTYIPTPYSFIDPTPYAALQYYRLRQIDLDGAIEFSHTVSVNVLASGSSSQFQVYPNPTNGLLNIAFDAPSDGDIQLLDCLGRILLDTSANDLSQLDISHLENGVYSVVLVDGHQTTILRIVKQG